MNGVPLVQQISQCFMIEKKDKIVKKGMGSGYLITVKDQI